MPVHLASGAHEMAKSKLKQLLDNYSALTGKTTVAKKMVEVETTIDGQKVKIWVPQDMIDQYAAPRKPAQKKVK
jgi:hypothetical protein